MSNKHMVIGLVAGIGIAAAGGVAAYQFMGRHADAAAVEQPSPSSGTAHAGAAKHAQTSERETAVSAAPAENCWDEEVTVQRDKTDEHAIAGTAIGAVVGGAIGKDVGHHGITTAAGAAAGAYIGRKIQQKVQDNQADARTETHVEHRCAPAGASAQHE